VKKCRKRRVKSRQETAAAYTDTEAEEAQSTGCNEEQKKCQKHNKQHTSPELLNLPESGLYQYFLTKLKSTAYLQEMRKQLIKHKGRVQCGKDVVCIARKKLAKLLNTLDKVSNTEGLKSKKQIARRLSKLLQVATHIP